MSGLGLHLIVLELTTRCNLKCIHCYRDPLENESNFNEEDLKIVFSELKRFKPSYLILSGGEPLLLGENLFKIAKEIRNYCKKIIVTTNGQLVRNYPSNLFKLFDCVQISLDGPREIHEEIRGSGTFEEAINSVKYLRNSDINVLIQMTVHSMNLCYWEKTYHIAKSLGARFGLERASKVGKGAKIDQPSSEEWRDLLNSIVSMDINCRDPLYFVCKKNLGMETNKNKISGGCMAGIASLVITSSLDVLPCVRLRMPVGNLKSASLEDLWLNSNVFKELRNRSNLRGKCGICKYRNLCGGCRADAYAWKGEYLESDPLCWIEVV